MSMRAWLVGFAVLLAIALLPGPQPEATAGGRELLVQADGKMKFEIFQDNAKEFRWRLKAANGAVLATSGQGYKAKDSCQKGVALLQSEVAGDKLKFEVYEDNAKEFRWRLKAVNGQVVATSSEGYKAKADCEKAVESIRKGAAKAEVEDKT